MKRARPIHRFEAFVRVTSQSTASPNELCTRARLKLRWASDGH